MRHDGAAFGALKVEFSKPTAAKRQYARLNRTSSGSRSRSTTVTIPIGTSPAFPPAPPVTDDVTVRESAWNELIYYGRQSLLLAFRFF